MNTIDTLNMLKFAQLKVRTEVLQQKEQYEKLGESTEKERFVKIGNVSSAEGMLIVIDSTIKLIDKFIQAEIDENRGALRKN